MVLPQGWEVSESVFPQELNRFILTKANGKESRGGRRSNGCQTEGISKHRPPIANGAEVAVFSVGELPIVYERAADVNVGARLRAQTIRRVRGVVLLYVSQAHRNIDSDRLQYCPILRGR